jgi:hypothetical protein
VRVTVSTAKAPVKMARRLSAVVVSFALLVGVTGAMIAWYERGGAGLFRYEQSRSLGLTPATVLSAGRVEAVVAEAPEPVAPTRRTRPRHVLCRPGGTGELRNPWSCVIRYRSGTLAHYRVVVEPNGFYTGTGTGIITGCCVKTPTLG